MGDTLIPLAGELREFEMPRPIFSSGERTQWATGVYNNRHTELQMRTDLTKVIKAAQVERNNWQRRAASFVRFLQRHSGGFELCLLRTTGSADAAQQSSLRALP